MEKEMFSFSKLDAFNNCPRSYYYTYILKQRGGDNIYSFLGTVVHEAVEKMDNKEITNEQGLELFLEAVDDAEILGLTWISDNVKSKYVDCVSHYFYNYKNHITQQKNSTQQTNVVKIHTEEYFVVEVGSTTIRGYIDKWYENNDIIYIEDYKTSSKFTAKDLIKKQRQLAIYAEALEKQYPDKKIILSFNMLKYALIKNKLVERNTLNTIGNYEEGIIRIPYTDELKQDLYEYVENTTAKIESLDYNIPHKWVMSFDPEKEFFCKNLCSHQKKCLNQTGEWE